MNKAVATGLGAAALVLAGVGIGTAISGSDSDAAAETTTTTSTTRPTTTTRPRVTTTTAPPRAELIKVVERDICPDMATLENAQRIAFGRDSVTPEWRHERIVELLDILNFEDHFTRNLVYEVVDTYC